MPAFGSLVFASPWLLATLPALPLLWWLLRVTPPAPRRVTFPAVGLLAGLRARQETPARTPWWLLLLRLLIAALAILALAHPILNPGAQLDGRGVLLLIVDDGWAAAPRWRRRVEAISGVLDEAERLERPVVVVTTAPPADGEALRASDVLSAAAARRLVGALRPKPWPVDRLAAADAVRGLGLSSPLQTIWFTDGILATPEEAQAIHDLTERLQHMGSVRLLGEPATARARVLLPPAENLDVLGVTVLRSDSLGSASVWIRGVGERGQLLVRAPAAFGDGERAARADIDVPLEIRNRLSRIEIEGERSAGAVALLDERWRRRPVGLYSGDALEADQPLLSSVFYLDRALSPFSDVRAGAVAELLRRELAVMFLADVGVVVGSDSEAIENWVKKGGVLVRFAGPKMAEKTDSLTPVALRTGGRSLGGALTWTRPARLDAFEKGSPFFGLDIPEDVLVARQVLAEPSLDLSGKTWARLADGTPLVTAERRGGGWVVLFHTTANTEWSNLAISGLFVDMLRRIVELAEGVSSQGRGVTLPPLQVLDGFGRLVDPPPTAAPIVGETFEQATPSPGAPPGYYGDPAARRALNLGAAVAVLDPIERLPQGVSHREFAESGEIDLKPPLLAIAVALILIEMAVSLRLRGLLAGGRRAAARTVSLALPVLGALSGALPLPNAAEAADDFALTATLDTRLAYVITGDTEVDEMSRAGLRGLTRILARRTAFEGGEPIGLDPESDAFVYFPMIYWPVTPAPPMLSENVIAKVDTFARNGGTIVFDTRERRWVGATPGLGSSPGPATWGLRRLLDRLDVPPLTPVPPEHVLTRAFYLIQEFPGRWTGGRVWVERYAGGVNDGVSGYVIGDHDWAAAWAIDDLGRPLAAVVPGGERQREMALRFGVNLVMYTLTGNYKADQVHVPAILERLGQ